MRTIIIATLLAFAGLAYAADDKVDKSAKKTGDGFGNLLKGMGQETKKATGGKDDKKASKSASSKEDKK
jgi:hypothetical protein